MISNETLESIQCCLSTNNHNHFVQSPIGMSCGHYVCKRCIPSDESSLKCSFCHEINVNNLLKSRESSGIKTLIKVLIDSLFKLLDEKYENTYKRFCDCMSANEDAIINKFKIIDETVRERVNALKNELDEHYTQLKCELDAQKDKILKTNRIHEELRLFEEKFKHVREENGENNELKLFEIDDYLSKTNETLSKKLSTYADDAHMVHFKASTFKFKQSNIGTFTHESDNEPPVKLNYYDDYLNLKENYLNLTEKCEHLRRENNELKSRLELTKLISNNEKEQLDKVVKDLKKNIDDLKSKQNHKISVSLTSQTSAQQPSYGQYEWETLRSKLKTKIYKTIDINVEAFDLCVLPNDQLLVVSYDDCSLILLNKHYEVLRVVSKLNGVTFRPVSVCTNMSDRLYISDIDNRCLIMTDLDFNFIKYSLNLNSPRGLCFNRNYVYVCESGSNRVSRFDYNLDTCTQFYVYDYPWQIKILNSLACVMHGGSSIRFYDVAYEQFKLVAQYNGHSGDILTLTSYFIEHSIDLKKFLIYDKDGCKIDEVKTDGFNGLIQKHNSYHGCVFFNESLVLTTRDTKKLILF